MTTFNAPPDQVGLILNDRDTLNVNSGGTASNTRINFGGVEYVHSGGVADHTTIDNTGHLRVLNGGVSNDTTVGDRSLEFVGDGDVSNHTTVDRGGIEGVVDGGVSNDAIIHRGGRENLAGGVSNNTRLDAGGLESVSQDGVANHTTIGDHADLNVQNGGVANDTVIDRGGVETVHGGGQANNVTFAGKSILVLASPSELTGTVADWRIGDAIDLLNTKVTSVHETGGKLTVNYGQGQEVTYTLDAQQAHTHVAFRSDGHGGTELVLTPVVGLQNHEAAIHFGPGHSLFLLTLGRPSSTHIISGGCR